MAMHLDHISFLSTNVYESADRLRRETGLGFYDGGYFSFGAANKIFPLGGNTYLEVGGIVDLNTIREPKDRPWWYERVATLGDVLTGLCLRVDTMQELEEIATKKGATIDKHPATRTRMDGTHIKSFSAPAAFDAWPQGNCNWYYFEDFYLHPSGQPVFNAPDLVRPLGISFLEYGGTAERMTEWLGVPESNFPFRYNNRKPGLYAVGVYTPRGEVVIRRPSINDV